MHSQRDPLPPVTHYTVWYRNDGSTDWEPWLLTGDNSKQRKKGVHYGEPRKYLKRNAAVCACLCLLQGADDNPPVNCVKIKKHREAPNG